MNVYYLYLLTMKCVPVYTSGVSRSQETGQLCIFIRWELHGPEQFPVSSTSPVLAKLLLTAELSQNQIVWQFSLETRLSPSLDLNVNEMVGAKFRTGKCWSQELYAGWGQADLSWLNWCLLIHNLITTFYFSSGSLSAQGGDCRPEWKIFPRILAWE